MRRVLAVGVVAAAAAVGLAATALRSRAPEPARPPAPASPPVPAPATGTGALAGAAVPLLPELPPARVPAGILARAADARALERTPSCTSTPPARRHELPPCVREERESIDIEWHVSREP